MHIRPCSAQHVQQIRLSTLFFSNQSTIKCFDPVIIKNDQMAILGEAVVDEELEKDEALVHPFVLEFIQNNITVSPINNNGSNIRSATLKLVRVGQQAIQSLEHTTKHVESINNLFAKPFSNQWLHSMIKRKITNHILVHQALVVLSMMGYCYAFQVLIEDDIILVSNDTNIILDLDPNNLDQQQQVNVGGLDHQIEQLTLMLDATLIDGESNVPHGLLLYGMAGTGKTLVLQ
jgi:hypothetical protein